MAHPKEEEVYPVGTVVRLKRTGEFALIVEQSRFIDGSFQNYLGEIEGREPGTWCLIHSEVELECLPRVHPFIF